jgi:predicted DNA binding protein
MGLVAEFEIGVERMPLVEVKREVPEATFDVRMQPTKKGNRPFILSVTHESPAAVERAFDASAFVGEYAMVAETGETHRYKIIPAMGMGAYFDGHLDDVSDLKSLATTESIITGIRVTRSGWIQEGWFADRETFDEFRTFWQRNGDFTLRRLRRDSDSRPPEDGLTDRQREALVTAYEMGYFDVPRGASLDEIAAALDISASSLSERLRRAQTHLVEEIADKRPDD